MLRFLSTSARGREQIAALVLVGASGLIPLGCTSDGDTTGAPPSVSPARPEGGSSGSVAVPPNGGTAGAGSGGAAAGTSSPSGAEGGAAGEAPSSSTAGEGGAGGGEGGAREGGASGSTSDGVSGAAGGGAGEHCWALPVVTRARLLPATGQAAALAGGKIVGSNESATNGFVDLATVASAPAAGAWVELEFRNSAAYRYVKYYSPPGSHGRLAELELYAGDERLEGAAFGTAGSLGGRGSTFDRAVDGNPSTWFEGPLANDNYVGVDLAAGHVAALPSFSPVPGAVPAGSRVTLRAEAGATITYTLDGADPRTDGTPYTGPIALPAGSTLLKAAASRECALASEVAQATYRVAGGSGPSAVQSSLHIGNSLTDTIVEYLPAVATAGGISLDFNRYTIPGAGTWLYDQEPTGGFGVANVQVALRTRAFDHVSMQPFPNMPCQPLPSSDGADSDSGYMNQAWRDARTQNPNVQLWVYQQWPAPVEFQNCISGGDWTRADWQPPAPANWEAAAANELTYQEAVRAELVRLNPTAPEPYIIPGGLALVRLKRAIEAGSVPGFTNFFRQLFVANGTDLHLTPPGAYYISLVFYSCMFQQSPVGLATPANAGLTAAQIPVFERLAWETVSSYPLSGVAR